MKNGVTLIKCSCKHEQQDKMYGAGVRVANATAKQDKDVAQVRCTVCGAIHRVSTSTIKG